MKRRKQPRRKQTNMIRFLTALGIFMVHSTTVPAIYFAIIQGLTMHWSAHGLLCVGIALTTLRLVQLREWVLVVNNVLGVAAQGALFFLAI